MSLDLKPSRYCPREGYKVASIAQIVQLVEASSSYCPREGYKVASCHLVHQLRKEGGYCPREGYKVASLTGTSGPVSRHRYCPREGYKVASSLPEQTKTTSFVTVPVRGIRLHHRLNKTNYSTQQLLSP